MDRFEVFKPFTNILHTLNIYIPVWIDLKQIINYLENDDLFNLHSSMDRFEASDTPTSYNYNDIYIPVWIDLKARLLT